MLNPLTSRAIVLDKTYKKFSQTAYDTHKQRLKQIYTKDNIKKEIKNDEQSKKNMIRLVNNRKAYESCHQKIDQRVQFENKSLVKNIQSILTRKSPSQMNLKLPKNHTSETKRKQVKKDNKIIVEKLGLSKLQIADIKRNLIKQFQQYEEKRNMLRKLKQIPAQKLRSSTKRKSMSLKKIIKLEEKKEDQINFDEEKTEQIEKNQVKEEVHQE